jgi:3-deoxy-D-manno-octulosonic-acid transferase
VTPTGSERVRQLFADSVFHVYLPLDLPPAVHAFLRRVRPRQLVLVEREIWPNLLRISKAYGIATLLANGRITQDSMHVYARFGGFARRIFGLFDRVAAQTGGEAERFCRLGVPRDHVVVTGNIKFDKQIPASTDEQAEVLRRLWGGRPTWVAASTHEGEDEQVLAAHAQLLQQLPDALLVLVPRHPERFDRVAQLCERQGFVTARRSQQAGCDAAVQVYLGDTMGELRAMLGAADAAFIGGSLVPVGGHNLLEASAQGVPVLFGPYMHNFAAISRLLLDEGAARQVKGSAGLARQLARWLADASTRSEVGERGRQVVDANRGALHALWELLEAWLPEASAGSPADK